jgi:(E)-4-hydroxy-3-methyl-but-2-enyl pyrophosphate reductase
MVKILTADTAGFCFGVRRAVELAEKISKSHNKVYTLGPLIHNPQEIKRLAKMGIRSVSSGGRLKDCRLVLRTHGIPSSLRKKLESRKLDLVDATCPFVKRAQGIVKDLNRDGYQTIIVGEADHPEVIGLVSYCTGDHKVVERPSDLSGMKLKGKVGVLSQTTQTLENFNSIIRAVKKTRPDAKIFNTICRATTDRQNDASKLAKQVDAMIVVGGKNSGNTRRLYEISRKYTRSHLIETASEIKPSWFKRVKVVGITAGASTPQWIISEVKNKVKYITGGNSDGRQKRSAQHPK